MCRCVAKVPNANYQSMCCCCCCCHCIWDSNSSYWYCVTILSLVPLGCCVCASVFFILMNESICGSSRWKHLHAEHHIGTHINKWKNIRRCLLSMTNIFREDAKTTRQFQSEPWCWNTFGGDDTCHTHTHTQHLILICIQYNPLAIDDRRHLMLFFFTSNPLTKFNASVRKMMMTMVMVGHSILHYTHFHFGWYTIASIRIYHEFMDRDDAMGVCANWSYAYVNIKK